MTMNRKSIGWGFDSNVISFNFRILMKFVLIFFIKPNVRKILNNNISGYANNITFKLQQKKNMYAYPQEHDKTKALRKKQ